MTQDELLSRLNAFEWGDFECKRALRGVPEDAYKTVSAFANTAGGWLVFGVSERGRDLEITGVEEPDKVQNEFLSTLRAGQKLNRVIAAESRAFKVDGKHVFAFSIPEAARTDKPVYLKGDPRQNYIRRGAGDERCTQRELEGFLRDAALDRYDGIALADISVDTCFDEATVDWYQTQFARRNPEHSESTDPIEFLLNWNFIVEQGGEMRPTQAGVLLFGKGRYVRQILPRPVLDYQRIDAPFELWSPEERWHDRYVFEENIFQTWQGLVARYMRIAEHPFSLDPATLRRNDDPPDYVAFRNWNQLGRVPPTLRNDKARKEFELVLGKQPLVTDAMRRFRESIGVNLNPEQAAVLALALGRADELRISLTDIRGLGINTAQQAKQLADFLVRQQLLEPVGETSYQVRDAVRQRFVESTEQVTPQVTPHVAPQVPPQVIGLLRQLPGQGEMTRQELMDIARLKDRKHFAEAYLQPSLDGGLLEMTIPDKPQSSKQRYRLTATGQAMADRSEI